MKTEIFCLAESASVKNNQMCILHTFTHLITPKLPAIIEHVVCVQMRFSQSEEGGHDLYVVLRDSDGNTVWRSDDRMVAIQFGSDVGFSNSVCTLFLLSSQLSAGVYELSLIVDGVEEATTILAITKIN